MSSFVVCQNRPRSDEARLDKGRERNARLAAPSREFGDGALGQRLDGSDSLLCGADIGLVALDPEKRAAEALGGGAGRARAEERVEHEVARLRRAHKNAVQKRLGLLRRMRLAAGAVLQPLGARADR